MCNKKRKRFLETFIFQVLEKEEKLKKQAEKQEVNQEKNSVMESIRE